MEFSEAHPAGTFSPSRSVAIWNKFLAGLYKEWNGQWTESKN
jgi:hypothetical protein